MIKNLSHRVAELERAMPCLKTKLAVWDPRKETREQAMARARMGIEDDELQIVVELVGEDSNFHRNHQREF